MRKAREGLGGGTLSFLIRPDQLNKLLHGFARSNFWANKKNLIKLGGAYVQ